MLNMTEILTTIKKLIEVRFKILKSGIQDQISLLIARVVMLVLMVLAASFVLLFGSISLAFYFSELYESTSIGFLFLTGIYFLIFIILYVMRNSTFLQGGLKNSITKFVFLFKGK